MRSRGTQYLSPSTQYLNTEADSLPGHLARAITPQRIVVQRLLTEHVEDCRDTAWIKKLAQPGRVIDVGQPEAASCEQPLTTSQSQNIEWRHDRLYTEPTTAAAIWTRGVRGALEPAPRTCGSCGQRTAFLEA